jgi:serine/threonine protein kinase
MVAGLNPPRRTAGQTGFGIGLGRQGSTERIDRYELLQKLGEGGCGVVYLAEQTEPVRRRVALKVIKLGMDTKQFIARFEAERQALALMDHPNIAKVLDAGATSTGRPYFVMELIRGLRITDYCDQRRLSTVERLGLFTQVCQAIQHAHQKGTIHRDIKPSNILVTLHDGVPVPKVIDFGIAKATEQALTDKTLFTAFGQFMGTPAYMSPEQAELSGLDIDTRIDIYALGVLLYELLIGRTPFDAKELSQAGLDEMRRRIREEEPLRPSTRLSTMAEVDLMAVARKRQSEPARLTRFVRGDLDWIVMKCLEKDRRRRYETANGLAVDILRHMQNEPVMARPPSVFYRFQKTLRRNRLLFSAGAAVVAALFAGLGTATWAFLKEKEAHRRAAEAEARSQTREAEARAAEAKARAQVNFFTGGHITRELIAATNVLTKLKLTHPVAPVKSTGTDLAKRTSQAVLAAETSDDSALPVLLPGFGVALGHLSGGGGNLTDSGLVVDPSSVPYPGYPGYAALWWKWAMERPVSASALIESPFFDVTEGQEGEVWFLGSPFGSTTRTVSIPPDKFLFFPMLNAESSSLEKGSPFWAETAEEQGALAAYFVDHAADLVCEIDGELIPKPFSYRFESQQFTFEAPTPWIFGDPNANMGGLGTSTGDGYYIMLRPLAPGQHILRFGGAFQFRERKDPIEEYWAFDATYRLIVE